jgi:hypothetical protein
MGREEHYATANSTVPTGCGPSAPQDAICLVRANAIHHHRDRTIWARMVRSPPGNETPRMGSSQAATPRQEGAEAPDLPSGRNPLLLLPYAFRVVLTHQHTTV